MRCWHLRDGGTKSRRGEETRRQRDEETKTRCRGDEVATTPPPETCGAVHSTQYTVHSTQYTVHSTAVHRTQRTPCIVYCTPHTAHRTPHTVHRTPCIVHRTPCTEHRTAHPRRTLRCPSRAPAHAVLSAPVSRARVSSSAPPRCGSSCASDTLREGGTERRRDGETRRQRDGETKTRCRGDEGTTRAPGTRRTRSTQRARLRPAACTVSTRLGDCRCHCSSVVGAGCVRAVRACGAVYGTPGPRYSSVPVGASFPPNSPSSYPPLCDLSSPYSPLLARRE